MRSRKFLGLLLWILAPGAIFYIQRPSIAGPNAAKAPSATQTLPANEIVLSSEFFEGGSFSDSGVLFSLTIQRVDGSNRPLQIHLSIPPSCDRPGQGDHWRCSKGTIIPGLYYKVADINLLIGLDGQAVNLPLRQGAKKRLLEIASALDHVETNADTLQVAYDQSVIEAENLLAPINAQPASTRPVEKILTHPRTGPGDITLEGLLVLNDPLTTEGRYLLITQAQCLTHSGEAFQVKDASVVKGALTIDQAIPYELKGLPQGQCTLDAEVRDVHQDNRVLYRAVGIDSEIGSALDLTGITGTRFVDLVLVFVGDQIIPDDVGGSPAGGVEFPPEGWFGTGRMRPVGDRVYFSPPNPWPQDPVPPPPPLGSIEYFTNLPWGQAGRTTHISLRALSDWSKVERIEIKRGGSLFMGLMVPGKHYGSFFPRSEALIHDQGRAMAVLPFQIPDFWRAKFIDLELAPWLTFGLAWLKIDNHENEARYQLRVLLDDQEVYEIPLDGPCPSPHSPGFASKDRSDLCDWRQVDVKIRRKDYRYVRFSLATKREGQLGQDTRETTQSSMTIGIFRPLLKLMPAEGRLGDFLGRGPQGLTGQRAQ